VRRGARLVVVDPSHPPFDTHRLEDLVAQDDIVSILTNLIDSDNLPHLLLYGPPGTGKTSTIVAAAKRMYGSEGSYKSMTLELNASDSRGIDVSGAEYGWMCVRVCVRWAVCRPDCLPALLTNPKDTTTHTRHPSLVLSFRLGRPQRNQRVCWYQTTLHQGCQAHHFG
jgi:hypothetical protein